MTDRHERLAIPEEDRAVSIRKDEAEFIHGFLRYGRPARTLETGLACSATIILTGGAD